MSSGTQNGRRLALIETRGEHLAVVDRIPTSARAMAYAQRRAAEDPPSQGACMDHGTDIGNGEEIENVVFADFAIHFYLGETHAVGERLPIARIFVFCRYD